ncbi:SRPBCC family protein [filamentous cyanobacterium LEGE 11480]|uniref:SRPBCC family protein n=1 Tax=Romeriopsis navalis LEGE 11480 TaxID=2777977 RepID=A0A928Z3R0_9CYAN|nr:SRPBCC family protein [Romeriopsis navalis]MBE9031771.1 SRPBCC family protein [Romeriopsis navalis LEGE 11480]
MLAQDTPPDFSASSPKIASSVNLPALLNGDVLLETHAHSAWGGAVTAQIYLPLDPQQVWQKLTDYGRWTQYFPDVTHSEILHHGISTAGGATIKKQVKRLYQAASKAFLMLTAKVEVHLKVLETHHQRIQFFFESGSFNEFSADLQLKPHGDGTILSYSVQATPMIPVPSLFIQQAMQMDLPSNLRQMRRVMCGH